MSEIINNQLRAWMRTIQITFTSRKYGLRLTLTQDDLAMEIEGYKYMSVIKDSCTIRLYNLTYSQIYSLISGEMYDVTVECGYKSGYRQTIFKGGVLYITNSLNDRKSTVTTILCGSEIIARFGQKRMNLSLQSGINMYAAIKFICERAGIPNTNISEDFKLRALQEIVNANDTVGNWLTSLSDIDENIISNADDSTNSALTMFYSYSGNQVIHKLSNDSLDISGGYPQLTTSGLSLTMMPTIPMHCGEIIQIDNSLINIYDTTGEKNVGLFLDPKGQYMIFEMQYNLENRGSQFSIKLSCKSRNLLMNVMGG